MRRPIKQLASTGIGLALMAGIFVTFGSSSAPAASSSTVASYGYLSSAPTVLYTFPLSQNAYSPGYEQFSYQMYRPLYWFGGSGTGAPLLNPALSLADLPQYSASGRTVTIRLKHYMWSDGHAVTARDVQFFMNLVKAERLHWPTYVPGYFPDDVTKVTVLGTYKVAFQLSRSYGHNSTWFLSNELSQITPIPTFYWDKVSATSPIKPYDLTPSGAAKVWTYLNAQSSTTQTYATNPLWRVVDGPWKLTQFSTTGEAVFKPNPAYSGPEKPTIKTYQMIPFTSGTAELNYLLSTPNLTIGSIPTLDVQAERSRLKQDGYKVVGVHPWATNYIPLNFNNPTLGPVVSQLYMRQAMQSLIDQQTYVAHAFNGLAVPTYGPVPVEPPNPFASAAERTNPYPFNPQKAVRLLTSHGWDVKKGGVSTCARAGSGPTECGAGIAAATPLSFTLEYASSITELSTELQFVAGNFESAGIRLILRGTQSLVYPQCTKGSAACSWQMVQGGTSFTYFPDYYPTPDEFGCTTAYNSGSYCNTAVDPLIVGARLGVKGALTRVQDLLSTQVPALWLPVEDNIVVYKANLLGGVPEDALGQIYPASWRFGH